MSRTNVLALAICAAALLLPLGCGGCGDGMLPGKEWSKAGSLAVPRSYLTIAVLQNGKVLVAGGEVGVTGEFASAAADLYDPATGSWARIASMSTPRNFACAAPLLSGKALVVGGAASSGDSPDTAEVYDPEADTWTRTANHMAVERWDPQCSLLPGSGKVLVTGGPPSTAVAELYDPDTNSFSPTGSMATARWWHTATVLASGKVLVAGGCMGDWPCTVSTDSAELYDPDTGEWADAGPMPYPVMTHSATQLLSGKVLVAGGCLTYDGAVGGCRADGSHPIEKRASLYDPDGEVGSWWSLTGALPYGYHSSPALLLGSGDVLLVGGGYFSGMGTRTELYSPDAGTWAEGPRAIYSHGSGAGAVKLLDGTWMVVGGENPDVGYVGWAEIFTE